MTTRRRFLEGALKGSALVALGPTVPGFLASAADAVAQGGDRVLVVVEMTGGNDGLNMVAPYADDHYLAARPTIGLNRERVIRVDDHVGLNPGMKPLEKLLSDGHLALVQGVGYPNPDRSHFESMDVWQGGDPTRKAGGGWLGRASGSLRVEAGRSPSIHVGTGNLPLALRGSATGVPTVNPGKPYDLEFGREPATNNARLIPTLPADAPGVAARRALIRELADDPASSTGLAPFVRRSSLQTYASIDELRQLTAPKPGSRNLNAFRGRGGVLADDLRLVGQLIASGFGTRVFYLSIGGFDTHANQGQAHQLLLGQCAEAIASFFAQLGESGQADRVILVTFSEFGRRVRENGSQGTDHGAASCMLAAGPAVRGGVVGAHPSLAPADLDDGDLRHHTDFRRVYATLLEGWLGCPGDDVLGGKFEPIPLLRRAAIPTSG